MPPIPPPRAEGFIDGLYWCAYGPEHTERLLVLHGGPGADHAYLLPQMLKLAESRELIFCDQRGGGRSKTDARDPVTWRTHVEDLERVVSELAIDPLTVIGYSWGGLLALLHAIEAAAGRATRKAARTILIDPAPATREYRRTFEEEFARRQSGPVIQAMREELAASGLRERDPEAYRQRSFELSVAGYFADPTRARDLTPFRVVGRVQQSVWESLGDFDLLAPGQLDTVSMPALVVHGRQDPIPLASSQAVARAIGAELVVLDDCGHVPYVEQPDALFGAIEGFLALRRPPDAC